jgi:topoisomerase-4 subunit B
MTDPFAHPRKPTKDYTAADIEVLEGIEPVRRRPGMFIGGTDEHGLHHLAAEVLDNAMDEVVTGAASRIEIYLTVDGAMAVRDNGRGIPVDRHPKFKGRSALEVILTTLHSGGKFNAKVYQTAGGLHGVGLSVVNALSDWLEVEVGRDGKLWTQRYEKGRAKTKLTSRKLANRRGTGIRFHPDPGVFGNGAALRPARVYRMARAKAYLFAGAEVRWRCDSELLRDTSVPQQEVLRFPGGLGEYLADIVSDHETVTQSPFSGGARIDNGDGGRLEWAIHWTVAGTPLLSSYCNTVPTPLGGTHEAGLRAALTKGLKAYGERVGNRRAGQITADDVLGGAVGVLSLFMRDPQFSGQTKEKLSNPQAARLVEGMVRDHFDHWLSGAPAVATRLLDTILLRAEERLRRRQEKDVARRSATRKLRLPGKLTDCTRNEAAGTEIFLVEGDSAGGSAKQARDRATQAVLPLRGKILNVISAPRAKVQGNQEIADLIQALGCGTGEKFLAADLRYEKVIIMTDADVDGAHIAALLMSFFYRELPGLINSGHLYLAQPPLYRLSRGGTTVFARDAADKEALLQTAFAGAGPTEVSHFKGLGEMPASQLRETTMGREGRTLLQVVVAEGGKANTERQLERLMGRKPELRLAFIQERADSVVDLDI